MVLRFGRNRRKDKQEPEEEPRVPTAEAQDAPEAPTGPQQPEAVEADEPSEATASDVPAAAETPTLAWSDEGESPPSDAAEGTVSDSLSSPSEPQSVDHLPLLSALLRLHSTEDSASLSAAAAQLAHTYLDGTHLLVLLVDKGGSFTLQAIKSAATGTLVTQLNDLLGVDLVAGAPPPRQGRMAKVWLSDTASAHIVSLSDLWGDVASAEACQQAEETLGISQVAALRLASAEEPLGIALFFSCGNPPDPAMLDALGRHLTVALANLRNLERARQFGSIDPIRWIPDRSEFARQLSREVNRARRYRHSLSVALLAVHNFDSLRLEYGWTVANRLLRSISSDLAGFLRESDFLGCYLHNGFGVILVQTPEEAASQTAERLREKAMAVRILEGEGGPVPQCLVASATFPEDGEDADLLMATAESRIIPEEQVSSASA